MPEQHPNRRRREAWTLSSAHETGQIVRIRCQLCRVTHYYQPDDLMHLFGDIDADDIGKRIHCEQCRRKDYLQVKLWVPTAQERQQLTTRRLVGVHTKRVPLWRDEVG